MTSDIEPPFDSVVDFSKAKPGDESYIYSRPDGETIDDFSWISGLEWFDDRDDEVKLRRQRWRLIEEDEIVLPDPFPIEDDE